MHGLLKLLRSFFVFWASWRNTATHVWCMMSKYSLKSLILAYIKKWQFSNCPAAFLWMTSGPAPWLRSHSLISRSCWYPETHLCQLQPAGLFMHTCAQYVNIVIHGLLSCPVAGVGAAGGEVPGGQTGWSHSRYGCWHLFQQGAAVANLTSWYNRVMSAVLEVEMPLIQSQLTHIDAKLKEAEEKLCYGSLSSSKFCFSSDEHKADV